MNALTQSKPSWAETLVVGRNSGRPRRLCLAECVCLTRFSSRYSHQSCKLSFFAKAHQGRATTAGRSAQETLTPRHARPCRTPEPHSALRTPHRTSHNDPARIRTWNLLIRSQTRYPLRHRTMVSMGQGVKFEHICIFCSVMCIVAWSCDCSKSGYSITGGGNGLPAGGGWPSNHSAPYTAHRTPGPEKDE